MNLRWEKIALKQIKYVMALAAFMFLGACTAENTQDTEVPEIIEADIQLPEEINPGEAYQLQVAVSQGDEAVTDANEVVFELWNDSKGGDSIQVEASHTEEGIYEMNHTFDESGVYTLQTHVTARSLHIMPKRQFHVGEVTEDQVKKAEENAGNQQSGHMDGHEAGGHH